MLLGVITPQLRLAGTLSVRLTVPVKPLRGVRVIVDVAELPTFTAAGDVALMLKSETGADCKRHPQPFGVDPHWRAPSAPAPGVFVQSPAGHQVYPILGLPISSRLVSFWANSKVILA
jgi:hypothetical protein